MGLYQENKLFANRFKKALESGIPYTRSVSTSVSVYFGNLVQGLNINTIMSISSIPYDVAIEEDSKRLYFGIKVREEHRVVGVSGIDQNDDLGIAADIYANSYSKYYTPEDEKQSVLSYLNSKGITDRYNQPLRDSSLATAIQSNPELVRDYGVVKRIESEVVKLKKAPIDIYLHPDIFKPLKTRDIFPIAFIDGDRGEFNYIGKPLTSRNSMSAFRSVKLSDYDYSDTLKYVKHCYAYCPLRFWAVYDIQSDVINRESYMAYNFDI